MAKSKGKGLRIPRFRPKVHPHSAPRCTDGKHDDTCKGKGREIVCARVTVAGASWCACTHL